MEIVKKQTAEELHVTLSQLKVGVYDRMAQIQFHNNEATRLSKENDQLNKRIADTNTLYGQALQDQAKSAALDKEKQTNSVKAVAESEPKTDPDQKAVSDNNEPKEAVKPTT